MMMKMMMIMIMNMMMMMMMMMMMVMMMMMMMMMMMAAKDSWTINPDANTFLQINNSQDPEKLAKRRTEKKERWAMFLSIFLKKFIFKKKGRRC